MTEKQEKIRYRLVWNRSGRLNRKGEGLVQVECQQGRRRIYFSTKVYLEPRHWRDGMVVDHELATDLNVILRRMRIDIERVELDFMKRDIRVTLPMLREAVKSNTAPSAKLTDCQTDIGPDGWLRKRTQKTGADVSIPIRELFDGRMLTLIDKYNGDIGRLCSKAPPNSDVNRTLKPLLAKVKAQQRVTFHSSRHTFATLLSERGLSPETIQHLLGHASAQTTKIYNEHAADRRREIMKDLVNLKHRKAR